MARLLKASAPVATVKGGKEVTVWGEYPDTGIVDLRAPDGLWRDGGYPNPQPADGEAFCYTDDARPPQLLKGKEYVRIYAVHRKKNWAGLWENRTRGGWVELALVVHAQLGTKEDLFVTDASGKIDEQAAETEEQRLAREFTEKYDTRYGTPTVVRAPGDKTGYAYQFLVGNTNRSIGIDAWATWTEIKRSQFVEVLPIDPRTNLATGQGNAGTPGGGNTQTIILVGLGASILIVVLMLVFRSARRK